jgi:hypothetical protein
MRRRQFITLGSSAALVWPLTAASAQQAKKIPRLCFLTFDPGTLESTRFKPFFQALRDLGYVDGQTITIDYLSANGHGERFADLAAGLPAIKGRRNSHQLVIPVRCHTASISLRRVAKNVVFSSRGEIYG